MCPEDKPTWFAPDCRAWIQHPGRCIGWSCKSVIPDEILVVLLSGERRTLKNFSGKVTKEFFLNLVKDTKDIKSELF